MWILYFLSDDRGTQKGFWSKHIGAARRGRYQFNQIHTAVAALVADFNKLWSRHASGVCVSKGRCVYFGLRERALGCVRACAGACGRAGVRAYTHKVGPSNMRAPETITATKPTTHPHSAHTRTHPRPCREHRSGNAAFGLRFLILEHRCCRVPLFQRGKPHILWHPWSR